MALLRPCFGYQCMVQKQHSNGLAADIDDLLSAIKLIESFRYERRNTT